MHFKGATSRGEHQGERSVALAFERHQLMTQVDTPFRQAAGNSQWQLLVPIHDFATSLHRPGSTRTPGKVSRAKHVDQVERTLLDPLIHAQVVEPEPRLGKVVVGRGEASLLHLLL